jgi:hypothetical protein
LGWCEVGSIPGNKQPIRAVSGILQVFRVSLGNPLRFRERM